MVYLFWSILGYLAMVGGIFGLIFNGMLFTSFVPTIALQTIAASLMLWARLVLGKRSFHLSASPAAGQLVTSGPYKFVRHPIYSAVCLFVWAAVPAYPTGQAVLFSATCTAGALLRLFCEERLLRRRYPEYNAYCHRTKRLIPFMF